MKSYFLERVEDMASARAALSEALPNQAEPWLLKDGDDVVAYFTIYETPDGEVSIQADLSGRHYDEPERVIQILNHLKDRLGGVVTDDDESIL